MANIFIIWILFIAVCLTLWVLVCKYDRNNNIDVKDNGDFTR